MCQKICPNLSRDLKSVRGARCRYPDRQVGLNRSWKDLRGKLIPGYTQQRYGISAPELSDRLDLPQHYFLAIRIAVRHQHKIIYVPTRSYRDADTAFRDVINHGPFFSDSHWIVQRQDYATSSNSDSLGYSGDGRASHGRVRVETAERMEMPLRGPDGAEAMTVREPGSFKKEPVSVVRCFSFVARKIEEAEFNLLVDAMRVRQAMNAALFLLNDNIEAARKRPE